MITKMVLKADHCFHSNQNGCFQKDNNSIAAVFLFLVFAFLCLINIQFLFPMDKRVNHFP